MPTDDALTRCIPRGSGTEGQTVCLTHRWQNNWHHHLEKQPRGGSRFEYYVKRYYETNTDYDVQYP